MKGLRLQPESRSISAPLKFSMDGCVKFAYPHGHDELLMIALDNKTKKQTLLRTVPDVTQDGTFREFLPHQVYKDSQGFPVTKADDYEMVMVHHHPLQKQEATTWDGELFAVHDPWRLSDDTQSITRQVATSHASCYPPHDLRWVPRRSFTYPTPCFPPIPFNFVRHRSL